MRRTSRLFNAPSDEVGWISTTDMFIVACCILLFIAVDSKRRASEIDGQLGSVSEQLELSKAAAATNVAQKLEDELIASQAESKRLKERLEAAGQKAVRVREQVLSQQRSINNKLVGLGGKLENVVFMVDVSRSMQSGKGPNGALLNNWVPIVEVIERWINGLDVRAAALIVFGDTAEVKVKMQDLNRGGREEILKVLKQTNPTAEGTNFLAAFEEAYRIPDLDTIIVFSDGLPSVDVDGNQIFVTGKYDSESDEAYKARVAQSITENVERVLTVHRRISELAKRHPTVAVNVIGLGAGVYNEKTGNLLNDLALKNGGVFLALPSRVLENSTINK